MRSKELWLVDKNRATVKLTAKAELNCEIYKSWRKCWKNQVSFCRRSSPVSRKTWMLPWKLRELKNTLGKLVVTVNLEAIWFEFWMKGAVEIFVFSGWWLSSQRLDIVSETHFSCDTVDLGLCLAILSSLLCPVNRTRTFASESKVMYFILFYWF